jgi:DNA (cytosine-5)-methyltransferase 1
MADIKKLKVASFFSGIGGFDLGLERVGMEVVFQSEINTFAKKVLRKHWPNVFLNEDINKLDIKDIPQSDLWCGGFPCQDLSLANQGKRKGLNGNRSGLFYKFSDLVSERLPRWIILENVPGLLNSAQGTDFQILLNKLDELGYCISWRILDAKYFGTPQRRRRVYIVASFRNELSSKVLFEPNTTEITSRSGLGKRDNTSSGLSKGLGNSDFYSIQHATIGRKAQAGPQAKGFRSDGETYTLDSRGSADAVCAKNDAFGIRKTSGISSGLDGSRYRAIGNAVAVPVIEWIGRRIVLLENQENSKSRIELNV